MATTMPPLRASPMALTTRLAAGVLLWAARVAADVSVTSSNSTLPAQQEAQVVSWNSTTAHQMINATVFPLTPQVGLGQSGVSISQISIPGTLVMTDLDNAANLTDTNIAYVQCDPNDDSSNISPSQVVNTIFSQAVHPKAILLYAAFSDHCNITGDLSFTSLFTMSNRVTATGLASELTSSSTHPAATIMADNSTDPNSSDNGDGGNSNPTTAVAMSILYSITGIITLLFLVIIATGAARAHRHPERYGPRSAAPGRARQSRAKGLARAMLETIPIVKFGDNEPTKSTATEVELECGPHDTENDDDSHHDDHQAPAEERQAPAAPAAATESGMGPNMQTTGNAKTEAVDNPGCSICTEDFTKGEDVRVLPCNHKFHPACIDPWLLNVSGTCPLCRVDLRPVDSNGSENRDELPPPLSEAEGNEMHSPAHRHRLSRYLELSRLRAAPVHERIAALRRMRTEEPQRSAAPADRETDEELSRRARLTNRLSSVLRVRTRQQGSSNDAPEEPAVHGAAGSS